MINQDFYPLSIAPKLKIGNEIVFWRTFL